MRETYHLAKGLLAVVLGALAIAGGVVLKNPDGDHFVGELRDTLRVGRSLDQVNALARIIRQLVQQQPSLATSDLMSILIEEHIRKPIIPTSMVAVTDKGVTVLSPWRTEIRTASERGSFGITIPMSQLGCIKTLQASATTNAASVSINGHQYSVPVTDASAVNDCRGKAIPDVTFWFTSAANPKP